MAFYKKDKGLSSSLKTLSGVEELSRQARGIFYDVGNIPKNMACFRKWLRVTLSVKLKQSIPIGTVF